MTDQYITLSSVSCEEIIINKRRYIGYACPCSSEDEAISFLQKIREEHKTASHHCYAYIVGENSGIMRYSDDGEPGGTAGLPIIEVLKNKHIVNACVVVVRYFGGVLLGTGGLVRAYTQSTQNALNASGMVCMEFTTEEYCDLPYACWDRFRYAAEQLPVQIADISYESSVGFRLFVRSRDHDSVFARLAEATDRKLDHLFVKEFFHPWEIKA